MVQVLIEKHDAKLITHKGDVAEALGKLRDSSRTPVLWPRRRGNGRICRRVRLTRQLDEDPYTDTFWGILTGNNGSMRCRLQHSKPLTVRKVASGTEIALGA